MVDEGVVELEERVAALDTRLRGLESVARVVQDIRSRRVYSARLHRAPHDYYDWTLADRAKFLQCNVAQLCKSIIMENVAWKSDMPHVPRFVCVIVQYKAKINSDKVAKLIRDASTSVKISRKQVNFQHAPPDTSALLTGFEFNGVSPFGMSTALPVIVSAPVLELPYIWLGGGAHDVKLKVSVTQCVQSLSAIAGDVSESRQHALTTPLQN
ncbi:hypothetical protein, variant 1 [Aphanomyces astaci]|uniref:YbaK/aminoacyl-tRNA synthetase-associated domain-containing protein n=1 Tax=Aphanomyces astaci TaxID=112090 RepID=W4HAL1_APHAT|nr:hypothetical protein, variant 1 [Aphanomyces astaci]ETV88138.1 hypothetical protein, variant 1 [Aphanomyces astaci]|eukprot:XP_009823001.1 hypothetical protein, variant 1 [Aphanomyces astaci]